MIRSLLALCLCTWTALAGQVAFVQERDSSVAGTTIAIPVTATTGHGLVIFVANETNGTGPTTIGDGGTNTYTKVDSIQATGNAWYLIDAYNCSITGGSLTVTVVGNNGSGTNVSVIEFSGQKTSACLDAHVDSTNTTVTPQDRSITTTGADFVIAAQSNESFGQGTAAGAYTIGGYAHTGAVSLSTSTVYLAQGAAGATAPTWGGWTTPDAWASAALFFLPAAGGGGPAASIPSRLLMGAGPRQ